MPRLKVPKKFSTLFVVKPCRVHILSAGMQHGLVTGELAANALVERAFVRM